MSEERMSFGKVIKNGIITENPTFRLVLGTCPTLAVTTSAINGLGMGAAATFVLICSNFVISLLRNFIPDKVRIPAFIVVICTFVTMVQLLMQAFIPSLYDALGIFIPLIVVNCIILARAEAFASKNTPISSAVDGLGMGDNAKAALMTRGLAEIARLGTRLGAQERTFAGLSGMGDLMVTCGSMHSRNLRAGILIGRGTPVEDTIRQVGTVEGFLAARAAWQLACRHEVRMPIVEQCYLVCYEGKDPRQAVSDLLRNTRGTENEQLWMK